MFGLGGLRLIFGVWIRPLEADFTVDRSADQPGRGASSLLVFGLGQPLLGRQVDVRGPRLILPLLGAARGHRRDRWPRRCRRISGSCVTFGTIASIGFAGAANATIVALVAQRFEKHRGLIYAICSAGGPLGRAGARVGWRRWRRGVRLAPDDAGVRRSACWWSCCRSRCCCCGGPSRRAASRCPASLDTCRMAFRVARASCCSGGPTSSAALTTLGLVHTHIVAYGVDRGLPQVGAARILELIGLVRHRRAGGGGPDRGSLGRAPAADRGVQHPSRGAALARHGHSESALLALFAVVFGHDRHGDDPVLGRRDLGDVRPANARGC